MFSWQNSSSEALCCPDQIPVTSAMDYHVTEGSYTAWRCSQMCYVTLWYFSQENSRVCFERAVINEICLHFICKRKKDFIFFLIRKQVYIFKFNSQISRPPEKKNQQEKYVYIICVTIELLFYHYLSKIEHLFLKNLLHKFVHRSLPFAFLPFLSLITLSIFLCQFLWHWQHHFRMWRSFSKLARKKTVIFFPLCRSLCL